MALKIKQEEILAIKKDLRMQVLSGKINKDMMICVYQGQNDVPKVMIQKYDGRPRGVLTTNQDGSVEAMIEVVKVNEQLAAMIKRKEDQIRDGQKRITTLCLDKGDGRITHGRIELKSGGVKALSLSEDAFGGKNISYDDLLTMGLQDKVQVFGTSKATSFLRLAFNKHKEQPDLNAAELFEGIQKEFGIIPPQVDRPENNLSLRR